MNTAHRPPHRHGEDEGETEPGGMPVEPDGLPMPGVPNEPEPGEAPVPAA
ncbi:hypothetical protein [Pseudorhodoferax sp. Leaf274]|nr:hypothetical protein [Pseudorhodoferax sp. Leaf274]